MSLKNPQSKQEVSRPILFICLLIIYLGFSPYTALAYVGLSWQSPDLTVRIDPATKNVEPGHTFTINVMVDGAEDLGAFQFDIIYDPAVVTVTDVELGPFLGSTGRTAQPIGLYNVAGIVTFGAFSFGSNAGPEGTGLLAAVTFTAAGSGTSALSLQNVLVTDTMANAQSASVKGGTVTVAAPTPTRAPTMTPSPTASPAAMPTLTSTATATEVAEPVTTVTPTDAAAATATSETTITSAAPPVVTETATSETVIAPTAPPVATDTATSVATAVPTPTYPLTSTPAGIPQPKATVTIMLSPTPGAVLSQTPTSTPWSLKGPPATPTAVESLSTPSMPASSQTAALSGILCWLSVGGIFFFVAGCIFHVLLRRCKE